MTTPHTPGPWKISERMLQGRYLVVAGSANDIVAYVNPTMTGEADARLIAAAPEMVATIAKCDAVAGKTVVKPAGRPAQECYAIPVAVWNEARALLARIANSHASEETP